MRGYRAEGGDDGVCRLRIPTMCDFKSARHMVAGLQVVYSVPTNPNVCWSGASIVKQTSAFAAFLFWNHMPPSKLSWWQLLPGAKAESKQHETLGAYM